MTTSTRISIVPLAEVASIEREIIAPGEIAPGVKYVGLEHIDGDGGGVESIPVKEGMLASTKHRFTPEHVLYGKLRPYLKKIACPDFDGVCSTDILPIRVGRKLDRRYLFHYLRTAPIVALATTRSEGANLPRLSPRHLLEFPVPVPSILEQKRIAAILDKADAIRRKRQESLRLADEFLRSVFLDMFGDPVTNPRRWREACFGHLAGDTFRNGLSPSHRGTVPGRVLTLSAITSGQFTSRHIKAALFDRSPSPSQLLSRKTFLVCRGNGNRTLVGVGAFPDRDSGDVCFPDTMIGVNPNRELVTQRI